MIYSINGIPCDSEYLEHHGILGQRKGVRKGPPYPLNSGDHTAAEKRAAKKAGIKLGAASGTAKSAEVKKKHPIIDKISTKIKESQEKASKKEAEEREKYVERMKSSARERTADAERKKGIQAEKDAEKAEKDKIRVESDAKVKAIFENLEKQETEVEKYGMTKEDALARGTAKDLLQFKGQLTSQEIQNALSRIDWEKKLDAAANAEQKARTEALINKAKKIGTNLYKNAPQYAKWWNAFAASYNKDHAGGKKLPMFDPLGLQGSEAAKKKIMGDILADAGAVDKLVASYKDMSIEQLMRAHSRLMKLQNGGNGGNTKKQK